VGALHVVAADKESAAAVQSNIETIVRPMYSNPPAHGARVVATVLGTPDLNKEWRAELAAAMQRVKAMRGLLREGLEKRGTPGTWSHITSQIGMFSYTGLTKEQSTRMTDEFHIYSACAHLPLCLFPPPSPPLTQSAFLPQPNTLLYPPPQCSTLGA
jgi:hypothetical protein